MNQITQKESTLQKELKSGIPKSLQPAKLVHDKSKPDLKKSIVIDDKGDSDWEDIESEHSEQPI
jgi:hypothetical protein